MRRRAILAFTALGWGLPSTAFAAEGHGGSWLGLPVWVWLWLNFFIFWGLLVYLLRPPLSRFFAERREQIRASMEGAERQRREAEELRSSLSEKIQGIHREIDELDARSRAEGEREREEIIEQARTERERLIERARAEIDRAVENARAALTRHTAELAVRLAEERLEAELDGDARQRLFDENLERLERTGA